MDSPHHNITRFIPHKHTLVCYRIWCNWINVSLLTDDAHTFDWSVSDIWANLFRSTFMLFMLHTSYYTGNTLSSFALLDLSIFIYSAYSPDCIVVFCSMYIVYYMNKWWQMLLVYKYYIVYCDSVALYHRSVEAGPERLLCNGAFVFRSSAGWHEQ